MAGSEGKKGGMGRKSLASDLSTEISYFAWKRGSDIKQPLMPSRPNAVRTA